MHNCQFQPKQASLGAGGPIKLKQQSCSMKFEHLPSVNLVWHDRKLQHGSSTIVGIEEPFRLYILG